MRYRVLRSFSQPDPDHDPKAQPGRRGILWFSAQTPSEDVAALPEAVRASLIAAGTIEELPDAGDGEAPDAPSPSRRRKARR